MDRDSPGMPFHEVLCTGIPAMPARRSPIHAACEAGYVRQTHRSGGLTASSIRRIFRCLVGSGLGRQAARQQVEDTACGRGAHDRQQEHEVDPDRHVASRRAPDAFRAGVTPCYLPSLHAAAAHNSEKLNATPYSDCRPPGTQRQGRKVCHALRAGGLNWQPIRPWHR